MIVNHAGQSTNQALHPLASLACSHAGRPLARHMPVHGSHGGSSARGHCTQAGAYAPSHCAQPPHCCCRSVTSSLCRHPIAKAAPQRALRFVQCRGLLRAFAPFRPLHLQSLPAPCSALSGCRPPFGRLPIAYRLSRQIIVGGALSGRKALSV